MNPSEQYAFSLARRSSLILWSYATPLRALKGRELCDVLIVFGKDIAIISVKEVSLTGKSTTHLDRWKRRAIKASVKQIYGAERWLRSATHVVRSDGSLGLPLPSASKMVFHRIAVALGSMGAASIVSGDFGKGFVHVFDERAFSIILGELDTPADLFGYLNEKAKLASSASHIIMEGGEEDLLAIYLAHDRSLPCPDGILTVGEGIWADFSTRTEYIAKKEADKASPFWDGLIESVSRDALVGNLEFGPSISETEEALRQMAAENRYHRRKLGQSFEDFLRKSSSIRSRLLVTSSGTIYVFLATPNGTNRQDRIKELAARCFVARGKVLKNSIVVGIATEQYIPDKGFSLDLFYMFKPDWTPEDQKALEDFLSTCPYFKGETRRDFDQPEYPPSK
jgi:hypothetical protein